MACSASAHRPVQARPIGPFGRPIGPLVDYHQRVAATPSWIERLLQGGPARWGQIVATIAASLVAATLAAAVLQRSIGIPDASAVYLLAVVAVGTLAGTWPAVATSVAAFLAYDFLFVQPFYTFNVAAPEEWLHLLLFLVVALVIGRLTALQRERAEEAERRAAEARALFAVTRDVAIAVSALEAAPLVCERVAREAEFDRVWLALGPTIGEERVIADTISGTPTPPASTRWLLRPAAPDSQPAWVRIHEPGALRDRPTPGVRAAAEGRAQTAQPAGPGERAGSRGRERRVERTAADPDVFRVPMVVAGEAIGSLWATRRRGAPMPGRSASRLLAAAADQLGQAVRRDRLAADLTAAEVGRQADALKTALLDSVSHDLRTPLAGIRAAAGNMLDPETAPRPDEVRELAASIDGEAQRLARLVRDLLDLSRIEAGALRPTLEPYELADIVEPVVERSRSLLGDAEVTIDLSTELPPVLVDAIYADEIVGNLLENAARYAPAGRLRLSGRPCEADGMVELVVEDDGPGVPDAALAHIFDKFYRVGARGSDRAGGRVGMGVGLAVVRGLAEAMGGAVEARRSALGGLAVVIRLRAAAHAPAPVVADPVAAPPPSDATSPSPDSATGRVL